MDGSVAERIGRCDWAALGERLDRDGYALLPPLLTAEECAALVELYDEPARFRSRIEMARYRFGEGEYQYFGSPLPPLVQELRTALYPPLAVTANRWMGLLGSEERFPADLPAFLDRCHAHNQTKPTPLLLRYETGGYNCLHQDLYGEVAFPLQVVFVLSQREMDYTGGELLLVEQRPRAQSAGQVVAPAQGAGLIFTNRYRPVAGSRGYYRATVRHGVSRLTSGTRLSLGVIFHDAR